MTQTNSKPKKMGAYYAIKKSKGLEKSLKERDATIAFLTAEIAKKDEKIRELLFKKDSLEGSLNRSNVEVELYRRREEIWRSDLQSAKRIRDQQEDHIKLILKRNEDLQGEVKKLTKERDALAKVAAAGMELKRVLSELLPK